MAAPDFPIDPKRVRYIKLGEGNAWFESCRANQRIEFGQKDISHELASGHDRSKVAAHYREKGRTGSKASDLAREIIDFYTLGADCLWITFAQGCLWWGFAEPEVIPLERTEHNGSRFRKLVSPWSNLDAHGAVLTFSSLSTRLTKVAAYRQTLCSVEASDYLVRRINGLDDPEVARAREVRGELVAVAQKLIAALHWRDFEILCDLILSRSGWQRVSELGGLQKDTDLVMEQLATGERAFVQIKSASKQSELTDYLERFEANPGFSRMFYVCHSPKGTLDPKHSSKPVHIWAGEVIAGQAVAAGLIDWLIEKAG